MLNDQNRRFRVGMQLSVWNKSAKWVSVISRIWPVLIYSKVNKNNVLTKGSWTFYPRLIKMLYSIFFCTMLYFLTKKLITKSGKYTILCSMTYFPFPMALCPLFWSKQIGLTHL